MLLLFDVDATLVRVGYAIGRTAFADSFIRCFGVDPSSVLEGFSFAGRTDRSIVRDVAVASGLDPSIADHGFDDYRRDLERTMMPLITPEVTTVLPGVAELLTQLNQQPWHRALVTGNIEAIAYHKLLAGGLANTFRVGAFGCEFADRALLPPLAIARANDAFGTSYSASNALVIGDAPADIACAHANGIPCLAVATGEFTVDELSHADAVLPSFADVHAAMQTIARFAALPDRIFVPS